MAAPDAHPASIRLHLLGIVLLGAILPLGLIGFWLTRSSVRSGEELLDNQLTASLQHIESSIATRWEYRRSDLLLLSDNESARRILATGVVAAKDSAYLAQLGASVAPGVSRFAYRNRVGRELYSSVSPASLQGISSDTSSMLRSARDTSGRSPRRTLSVSFPVYNTDTLVGTVEASIYLDAVVPSDSARMLVADAVLAVRDRTRRIILLPLVPQLELPAARARVQGRGPLLAPQLEFPAARTVVIDGARWMFRLDSIADPPFDLALGAPVAPYVTPFQHAGQIGLAALVVVALVALLLSGFLTTRLARASGALVDAANAVAGGDLTRQAELSGPREFHQLAGSFNTMTESLRRLVAELSQRRALAAVGEFAASLSHEVRNALTSVQIDLERVEERSENEKNRVLLARALAHVRRLDAAVTGSLRIARSGSVVAQDVSLGEVLHEAIRIAEPSFAATGARVIPHLLEDAPVVRGDAEALHQLFLNLLLNAQQSLSSGGATTVSVETTAERVVVSIADTGTGMTSEQVAHAFDLHYTTRPKGTGLGLPIARQIAVAHGGELRILSEPGAGTTVEVELLMPTERRDQLTADS